MLENVIGCLKVEIGADRNLVLRVCSSNCESVEILATQRDIVAHAQFDAAANQRVRAANRSDVNAEATRRVKDDVVGRSQTGAPEALNVGAGPCPTAQAMDGDFGADEHEFDSGIDAQIETKSELRSARGTELGHAIDAGV